MSNRTPILNNPIPPLLIILGIIFTGCDNSPNTKGNQSPNEGQTVEAMPFRGEVYRTADSSKVLTLISPDEVEVSEFGKIFLCKYSKQGDALRVVGTAQGATQVLYFKYIKDGLKANDGTVLLSPKAYSAMEQAQNEREIEEATRLTAAKFEREAQARLKAENDRATAALVQKSRQEGSRHGTFRLVGGEGSQAAWHPVEATITDVSLTLRYDTGEPKNPTTVWFSEIKYLEGPDEDRDNQYILNCDVPGTGRFGVFLTLKNKKEGPKFSDTLSGALQAWRTKWPDLYKPKR
jgi:hypothetical protein